MDTITTLITGGSLKSRLKKLEGYNQDLSAPPFILDGQEETIDIKTIRQFQKEITFLPAENQLQRHFIIEAQNLSLPAQHALLKTLEEPPVRTQIILTADRSGSLIETILSRCHHLKLETKPAKNSAEVAKKFLQTIISSNHGQLIELSSKIDKKTAKKDIASLMNFLRSGLIEKPTISRVTAIKATSKALSDLETNANKQIILEHLFFTLRSLNKR